MEHLSRGSIRQIYFFIGRTTPPHFGHIHVIRQTIELARANGTCALILLGNGPGGVRTRDNPVEHETKAAFLIHKLTQLQYVEGTDFIIQMMKNPPNRQIVEFVRRRIPEDGSQMSIFQVAGNKDDDVLKHDFVRTATCKTLQVMYNTQEKMFNCGFIAIDPATAELGSAMSATKVRNKAVECYEQSGNNLDAAFRLWLEAFPFYSGDADTERLSKEIYEQIIAHKDTTLKSKSKSKSKTQSKPIKRYREHEEDEEYKGGPKFVSSRSAKGRGSGGGSRRKNTRRCISKLRNKKTLRNNCRHIHRRS